MNNKNYNYEIEKYFAKYGGEADKDITRTCGNCDLYNKRLLTCQHVDNEYDTSIYEADESGCYYHRTHEENERLKLFVKQRQDEANRLRLEEQRRNGTDECEGCPFREMDDMLQKVIGLDVLAGYWDTRNNCSLRESIEKLLKKAKEQQ